MVKLHLVKKSKTILATLKTRLTSRKGTRETTGRGRSLR
jgi:hypothetical protein